jgi:hypothetical protein
MTGINPATGKPSGTNCTICVANHAAASTDWNYGLPMLPAGKYVVEMVLPPGYELVKEEDKNILLGDAYVAPVTQQFAGFGNIFIMPDQATVAASYNANNPLNLTTDLGVQPRHEGDTGSVETFWPCVGTKRIVPDYMSLFPLSGQNAPFAGATRPLCDRKEVTLEDEMTVLAKFYVFTSAHIAAHYTGIITDDFTSEFDPFSPAFGEKFAPANLPVSVKDWAGNEISRVWSDQHGIFNGLTYSTWSVNPPDPSGYIPQMMVMCMNDRGTGPDPDKFYQAAYSQFCYEWSFMPGQTSYLDTPVIPTAAFAPSYNHPDCAYPNATPAIAEADGDGVGPWVSQPGHNITIMALGDQVVNDYAYSGPSASTAPWNQKTITRHYGFGTQCTAPSAGSATCNTLSSVTIGGANATIVSWSDTQIVATVPGNVPECAIQQQVQYGNPNTNGAPGQTTRCGELVITAGNGRGSIDTVTVTVRGKAPTHVAASASIQSAIDAASPGDLIMVDPTCMSGTTPAATPVACGIPSPTNVHSSSKHHELLLMWKPVRLQGAGAASTIIDANAHPSGILNDWRLRVVCVFGIAPTGVPAGYDPGCGSGWNGFRPTTSNPQVDRLPLESVVGWDASLNGNLAEQLQEPSLMGAYEGAGITVLSKGVLVPEGSNPWTDGATIAAFPAGSRHLTAADCSTGTSGANLYPSSFYCNPSSIDGLSITNSSQGGGGIFVHGWAHNLQIANNRIYNNQGTLAGGISIGQGEHPDAPLAGGGGVTTLPGSCISEVGFPANTQLPHCFDRFVNVHNNAVTSNASEGDELFSATPSGAGGVAFCTGTDNYKFNHNWVCGNLTTGDGAGVTQVGFVWNGDIEHNAILFNQATNPTTPSNGGGLMIMSAPDTDPTCPGPPDADCNHAYGTVGEGIGPGLTVNANLIMGNAAEAGSGGGVRFQGVNGLEVGNFPDCSTQLICRWFMVSVTNNIIANNVAGWDGGGVSLQDSIGVNLINNTIVSNDSTASSGTLFGAFFADQASAPTPCARDVIGANVRCVPLSTPQPAGVSAAEHTAEFLASLPASITCPPGHPLNTANPLLGVANGACRHVSFPVLFNDVLWQNRAFHIVVVQPGTNSGQQQATVSLVPQLNQASTGACVAPQANSTLYWDIGLRGDTGPTNHNSGFTFQPKASVLTSTTGYPGGPLGFAANTSSFSPGVLKQYCNGSKIPPEAGKDTWYQVPPGTNEGNVPVPVFSLTAGATVDEGNNWVNISWGPLSLVNPTTEINPSAETMLGDYSLAAGSPAIDYVTLLGSAVTYLVAPGDDFFGTLRKTAANPRVDAGAVEFTGAAVAGPTLSAITPNSGVRGQVVPVSITGTNLTGATINPITGITISGTTVNAAGTQINATFTIARNPTLGARNVTVTTPGGTSNAVTFTVQGATVTISAPSPAMATIPANTTTKLATVTVTNAAAATGPINISAIAVTKTVGPASGVFSIVAGPLTTCVAPMSLAPGANCTIRVQYAPGGSTGTSTAHIALTNTGATTQPLNGANFTAN